MTDSPRNPRYYTTELLALAFICIFCFFYGLGSFGLVGADEPRYAQIAREMLERHDFVTPRLHGEVWLEKPILYYWQAALAFKLFGVSDWAARLPGAVFALCMVAGIYWFMRRFRPGAEFDAAIVTAASAAVLGFARGASTDMQLAAPFTLAMLCWYAWYQNGKKWLLLTFYVLLAVGTLAKGPVSPGLAVFILVLFAALRREWPLLQRTFSILGLLLYCAIALPWYIAVQLRNPEFLRVFFLQHNLERFATNRYQHSQPFWYYGAVLLASLLPWLAVALPALFIALRDSIADWRGHGQASEDSANEGGTSAQPENSLRQFVVIWAIFPVLFFSLSRSKLPGYILPAIPACTILLGDYLFRNRGSRAPRLIAILHPALMGLLAAGVLLAPNFVLAPKQTPPSAAVTIAGGVALAVALGLFVTMKRTGLGALRPVTALITVMLIWFLLRVAGPSLDAAFSARSVERFLESLPVHEKTVAVFHVRRDVEFGLGFYRNEAIPNYDRNEIPKSAHLLLTYKVTSAELETAVAGRHTTKLTDFAPQKLGIYWVAP